MIDPLTTFTEIESVIYSMVTIIQFLILAPTTNYMDYHFYIEVNPSRPRTGLLLIFIMV